MHLGIKKYWGLYLGSIVCGYYGDKYIFKKLQAKNVKLDDIMRRNNIINNRNIGYTNINS